MTRRMNASLRVVLLGALLGSPAFADDSPRPTTVQPDKEATGNPPADDTATNKRDRQDTEVTADQGKNDQSDLEIARRIRRSIVSDKKLSSDAHNVKIIAQNGSVTLKGPVPSAAEKDTVESKAIDVAGKSRVKSELEVKP